MPQTSPLTRLEGPIETAIGLPSETYTSAEALTRENRAIFAAMWTCIALLDDVPEAGDARPVEAAGQPLLIVRTAADQIRVFHNVCRHRGALLVDRPQSGLRRIVCPYHSWTYELTGALCSTPHFSGIERHEHDHLDEGARGLAEVRAGVWNRLIFVDLSGEAPSLDDWLRPLVEHWQAYDYSDLRHGGSISFEIEANWKLVLDNFLESYHLPWVHRSLNRYSPLDDHELVIGGDLYMGQLSLSYQPDDQATGRLPCFPDLPADRQRAAEYLLLFPSLMLSSAPDHFRATILTPLAPDRTLQRWEFFFVGDAALEEDRAEARQALVERIAAVNREDMDILKRLQQGRRSPGFDGGRFSPYHETTVHNFHRLVAERLASIGG